MQNVILMDMLVGFPVLNGNRMTFMFGIKFYDP